jgi:hypothetical protein
MDSSPTKVTIHEQNPMSLLRERNRKVCGGGAFPFLRPRTCNHDSVKRVNRGRKEKVRPQCAICFRTT